MKYSRCWYYSVG